MNGTLDGNMANQTAVFGTFVGGYRYGIDIRGGDDVTFLNMEFINVSYGGVILQNSGISDIADRLKRYRFINCRFIDMGASAIRPADTEDMLIIGCEFRNWGVYNGEYDGRWTNEFAMISMDGGFSNDYFKYINNTAYAVSDSGFSVESVRPVIGAQIIGNKFYGDYTGVSGQGWINCIVTNNIWDSSTVGTHRAGLEFPGYGNKITDNYIYNGTIKLSVAIGNIAHGDLDTVRCYGNNVSDNTIRMSGLSNTIGIRWTSIFRNETVPLDSGHFNICNNNIIDLTGATGGTGILVGVC